MMKTAKVATVLFLSMLPLGAISMSLVACNNDDNEESPEVIDRSPAQAIDLGLPSGTLWASCNVGATKPEEYGDYFAWGETQGYNSGKRDFSWSTYKWCNGADNKLTKYCNDYNCGNNGFTDNRAELDLADDAAYVNWGSNWRIPSETQIRELINNCDWEWTMLNGVYGQKATSKKNGNSIFLPAAGRRYGTEGTMGTVTRGYYWSRSLYTHKPDGTYYLEFRSGSTDCWGYFRCGGQSVRPVRR